MRSYCLICNVWDSRYFERIVPRCTKCGNIWTVETCYMLATLGSVTLADIQNEARNYVGCDTCKYRFECFTS